MEEKYEEIDHEVSAMYDIKKRIGKGAYGIVWEATGKKNKKTVAVKKIFDAFRNRTDAMRTYREVVFMKEFQFHPNIIQLLNIFKAHNDLDIYLVMDKMDADLHSVIEEKLLKSVHKQFITYQLLCAVDCLSSFNVIHRDLKPSNILLNANCHVRVADFGLARCIFGSKTVSQQPEDGAMTDYVATRWYRAPEILLANQTYTCGVDMWSLGCILGEMMLGKPLFPGTSTVNQIELIVESVLLPQIKDLELTSHYAQTIVEKANSRQKRPFVNRLPNGNEAEMEAIELLKKILIFQPNQRLTAQQALSHNYVTKFGPQDKSKWPKEMKSFSADDDANLGVDDYRRQLYQIIEGEDKSCDIIDIINGVMDSPENRKQSIKWPPAAAVDKAVESCSSKVNKDYYPPAGLPSTHPRATLSNAQLRYHCPASVSRHHQPSPASTPHQHKTNVSISE